MTLKIKYGVLKMTKSKTCPNCYLELCHKTSGIGTVYSGTIEVRAPCRTTDDKFLVTNFTNMKKPHIKKYKSLSIALTNTLKYYRTLPLEEVLALTKLKQELYDKK